MLQTIKNAFKIPELRKKLIYTLIILLIYRFGAIVPVPFVQSSLISLPEGSIFEYLNILSGDAFSKATLFALFMRKPPRILIGTAEERSCPLSPRLVGV